MNFKNRTCGIGFHGYQPKSLGPCHEIHPTYGSTLKLIAKMTAGIAGDPFGTFRIIMPRRTTATAPPVPAPAPTAQAA